MDMLLAVNRNEHGFSYSDGCGLIGNIAVLSDSDCPKEDVLPTSSNASK